MTQITSQPEFDFTTQAPFNQIKLAGQNKACFDYLMTGKRLNRLIGLGLSPVVGNMQSRIPEIGKMLKQWDIKVHRQMIEIHGSHCKEYWIEQKDIELLKSVLPLMDSGKL